LLTIDKISRYYIIQEVIMMSEVAKMRSYSSMEEREELIEASKVSKEFISLYRNRIISLVRDSGIECNAIKGIEVDILIGITLGRSVGMKKFVYFSRKLGTVGKLNLYFGKANVSTYLSNLQVGGRRIGIRVYL